MKRIDLRKVLVARSNTIRDINRQIVLNYVREKGPISRADIARETALQRSTVSLIVSELKKRGLIKEVFGESSGGRPPTLLTLRTDRPVVIGVDLGTVKTAFATSETLFWCLLRMVSVPASCSTGRSIAGKAGSPVNLDICGSALTHRSRAEPEATSAGKHLHPSDRLLCVMRSCSEIETISTG